MGDVVNLDSHLDLPLAENAALPLERRRRTGGRGAERSRKPASGSKYLNLVNGMAKSTVLS